MKEKLVKTFSLALAHDHDQFMDRNLTDKLRELVAFAKTTRVDRVVVALPEYGGARFQEILLELGQLTANVDFCPGEAALDMKRPGISYLGGLGLYNMQESPIGEWGVGAKRGLDFVGASIGLLFFAIPMWLIARRIRQTSPGPASSFRKKGMG